MTPYVNMSILTVGLNILRTKAHAPIKLPAMQTARHPYRFVRALTTGPETKIISHKKNSTSSTVMVEVNVNLFLEIAGVNTEYY